MGESIFCGINGFGEGRREGTGWWGGGAVEEEENNVWEAEAVGFPHGPICPPHPPLGETDLQRPAHSWSRLDWLFFFFIVLSRDENPFVAWKERRSCRPLPRPDWLCHKMAKSTRINVRPTRPRGEDVWVRPFGRACLLPWEQGRGTRRGWPPLSSYLLFPPPPAPRGCLFMGHICWLAGDMSLVRMPGVPKEPGKWGTFLRTRLFACSPRSLAFWPPIWSLSPPTARLPALYLAHTSHLRCARFSKHPPLPSPGRRAPSLSALCPSVASTGITVPRGASWTNKSQALTNQLRFCLSDAPHWRNSFLSLTSHVSLYLFHCVDLFLS